MTLLENAIGQEFHTSTDSHIPCMCTDIISDSETETEDSEKEEEESYESDNVEIRTPRWLWVERRHLHEEQNARPRSQILPPYAFVNHICGAIVRIGKDLESKRIGVLKQGTRVEIKACVRVSRVLERMYIILPKDDDAFLQINSDSDLPKEGWVTVYLHHDDADLFRFCE